MRRLLVAVVLFGALGFATRVAASNGIIVPNCIVPAIVTPGSDISVACFTDANDLAGSTAELIALTEAQALAIARDPYTSWRVVPDDAPAIASARLTPVPDYSGAAVLAPPDRPGVYLVRVERGASLRADRLVSVSTLGLMSVSVGSRDFMVPVDLRNYRVAAAGRARMFIDGEHGAQPIAVDADGVADLVRPRVAESTTIFAVGEDGSLAFAEHGGASSGPAPHVAVQTDRPIYRAGDLVHIRAIVRDGWVGEYRVPASPLPLTVEDSTYRTLTKRMLRPDRFGMVSADVRLPADAPLGEYGVKVDGAYAWFSVQAYRKPEYVLSVTPLSSRVLGGQPVSIDARLRYVFGSPASGLRVHYSGSHGYWDPGWYSPFSGMTTATCSHRGEALAGDLTTDARGDAHLVIPTAHDACDQTLWLQFDARDASGHTVSTQTYLSVASAAFSLELVPEEWVGDVGRESVVDVRARNLDGTARANASVEVRIVEERYVGNREIDSDAGTVRVRTDAAGKARLGFTPARAGTYRFDARSRDEHGYDVLASQMQWVVDPRSTWVPNATQLTVVAEKPLYEPGETARVLVALPHPGGDVVVMFSSDHYLERRVVHVIGATESVSFDPPRGVDRIAVDAFEPGENGTSWGRGVVLVDPQQTRIALAIRPSKPSYAPGERATWYLHATDARSGAPVRAQIGLGVVDAGIYALAPDDSEPHAAFYRDLVYSYANADWFRPRQPNLTVAEVVARQDLVKGGVGDDVMVPATPAQSPALGAVALRRQFVDTAYWSPSVETDANGNATVHFAWPDNLTTWVATGVAVDRATRIGRAVADALVTKPLLVRLETPRFLRAGDRAEVVGIVHGPRANDPVAMRLDAPILAPPSTRSLVIGAGRSASSTWNVAAPGVGLAALDLRAADGTLSDGVHATLPLLGANALEHERSAGALARRSIVPTDLGAGELAGALHLRFSPSPLAELAATMRAFGVYPYYCTEQTASNGLVAAALEETAMSSRGLALDPSPAVVIAKARSRLQDLRRADGSWGWWSDDTEDPFMSAYALFALATMEHARPERVAPDFGDSIARLRTVLRVSDADAHVRAFARYAVATADPQKLTRSDLDEARATIDRGDAAIVALDGLVALARGDAATASRADARLQAIGQRNGTPRTWSAGPWNDEWWSDPVTVNALVAMFYDGMHRDADRDAALASVRALRGGDWWYTTLDTALASLALADAERGASARPPNATVVVRVGTAFARTFHLTSLVPDAADADLVIPASVMQSHEPVTIERSGTSGGSWSSDFEKYADRGAAYTRDVNAGLFARLFRAPPTLQVSRRYTLDHAGAWRVGDIVTVDLWISSREDARYVTLEDPFPAGAEYQPLQGEAAYGWSGMQFLDDRAAFFFSWLPAGQTEHVTYRLRVTTPGSYRAPGPSAFASYGPPQAAIGTGEDVRIVP